MGTMRHDERAHDALSCSFCGKGQEQVRNFIAGPNVFICDQCVSRCVHILVEERTWEMSEGREAASPRDAPAAAARLIKACEADPRVPRSITDLAVALAVALDKHLNPHEG
jgi:hypothetical protein